MGLPDYASILIVAALIAALLFFSLAMLGWCTSRSIDLIQSIPSTTTNLALDDKLQSFTISLESRSKTFQYRTAETVQGTDQTECIICLAPFEEEDSVRQLHSCKHIFHTICIDTWLASHSGCPLCRTQIDHVPPPNAIEEVSLPRRSVASEDNDHNQMILFLVSS
ncbi:RING-H2 finger protein ATL11-like [Neltuma alba]|uniref:RING-H2 finger protein ATL11-like n=1 Tax=Neltuma alba TaxID=207710 RepID=UPI0010A432B1|nr:RING-H2 finger protein ATL11-like [Prosopis alba]